LSYPSKITIAQPYWLVSRKHLVNGPSVPKQKIIATVLISAQAAQFYKFITAAVGSKITIHKHGLEPLTMIA
jgi:hypothetical protein